MSQHPVVENIKAKVAKVVARIEQLNADYAKVSKQRDKLKAENTELNGRILELEKRVKMLELAQGVAAGKDDKKLARARVNRLMREVDACIAILNK